MRLIGFDSTMTLSGVKRLTRFLCGLSSSADMWFYIFRFQQEFYSCKYILRNDLTYLCSYLFRKYGFMTFKSVTLAVIDLVKTESNHFYTVNCETGSFSDVIPYLFKSLKPTKIDLRFAAGLAVEIYIIRHKLTWHEITGYDPHFRRNINLSSWIEIDQKLTEISLGCSNDDNFSKCLKYQKHQSIERTEYDRIEIVAN